MLKWSIRMITAIIACFTLLAATILFAVDPNDFKSALETTLKDQSHLNIKFDGPLSWKLYPSLSIYSQNITLRSDENSHDPIVSIQDTRIGITLNTIIKSIFDKNKTSLNVDDIYIAGLWLNLIEDANGELNLVKLFKDHALKNEDKNIHINIPNIRISDSIINYTDKKKQTYSISLKSLSLHKPRLNENFKFSIDTHIKNTKDLSLSVKSSANLKANIKAQEYQLSDLSGVVTLYKFQGGDLTTQISTQRVIYDQAKKQLNTAEISIQSSLVNSPKKLEAQLHSQGLHVNMRTNKALGKNLHYDIVTQGITPQHITLKGSIGTLSTGLKQAIINLETLNLNARISGLSKEVIPTEINIDTLSYSLKQKSLNFKNANLKTLGINAHINLNNAQLGDKKTITGSITTNIFNLQNVLVAIGKKTTIPNNTLQQTKINTNFSYSNNGLSLSNLRAGFDDSIVYGFLNIRNFSAPQIETNITINNINLNRYLSPTTNAENREKDGNNSVTDASENSTPILPLNHLRKLKFNMQLQIGNLIYNKHTIDELSCRVKGNGNSIDLSNCSMRTLGGSLAPQLKIGLADNPNIQGSINASDFAVETLSKYVTEKNIATGQATLKINFNTRGNSSAEWINNNTGNANIDLKELLIKNINLNKILDEKLGSELATIISSDLQRKGIKIPFSESKDTYIKHFEGQAVINGATIKINNLSGALKNNDQLLGDASYNPISNDFDAHLKITLDHYKSHPYLANVQWPLRCNGNLNSTPLSWCNVDQGAMQGILKSVALNASKAKARELLEQRLGITTDPNKSIEKIAQEEISNRVQDKIELKKEEINQKLETKKQELNDKVNASLNKALGNLLGGE